MRRPRGSIQLGLGAGVLAAGLLVGGAAAQAPGIPVINAGVSRGLSVAGMAGFPNSAAGAGTVFGANGMLGFRRIALSGVVSRVPAGAGDSDGYIGAGGSVIVKVAGGPLVPVSLNLLAGAAYSQIGPNGGPASEVRWHVPVSLGISWTIAQPVVALKPWLAPRLDYGRSSEAGLAAGESDISTDARFGLSGGLTFGFLNGLGIDLAFDRVFVPGVGSKPTTLGVGLSWNLR